MVRGNDAPERGKRLSRNRPRFLDNLNAGILTGGTIVAALIVCAAAAPYLTPYGVDEGDLLGRFAAPSSEHWLGTDALGRDLLTRLIWGARVSLVVGLGSVLAAACIGIPIGILAGYEGGRLDDLLMRAMDVFLSVPKILIAILIMAVAGAGITNLIVAIGIWNIPVFARIARSTTLSLRERDFIVAANALGGRRWRVMLVHILPNALGELIVIASLAIAGAILAESGLSFLGLGVPPHVPSWGMIISEGRPYLRSSPAMTTYAGLCIMLAVLGFNLLGDGLRDALDPKRESLRPRNRKGIL